MSERVDATHVAPNPQGNQVELHVVGDASVAVVVVTARSTFTSSTVCLELRAAGDVLRAALRDVERLEAGQLARARDVYAGR